MEEDAFSPGANDRTRATVGVTREDVERIELDCLLEAVYRRYGWDFREYSPASLRRRVWRRIRGEGLHTVSALQERILRDPNVMERLLLDLSISVTAMFRDPSFYRAIREQVVPLPIVEISHVAAALTGVLLLVLARGLAKGYRIARSRLLSHR